LVNTEEIERKEMVRIEIERIIETSFAKTKKAFFAITVGHFNNKKSLLGLISQTLHHGY
jgi:hypothetical protein